MLNPNISKLVLYLLDGASQHLYYFCLTIVLFTLPVVIK